MSTKIRCLLFALVFSIPGGISPQETPNAPTDAKAFAGRWEVAFKNPQGGQASPLAIIEISVEGSALSAKLVSSTFPPASNPSIKDPRVQDGQLSFVLSMGADMTLRGKRIGDRIEGSFELAGTARDWIGTPTTKDKLEPPVQTAEQKAFSAAMQASSAERIAALKKFLADYPDSTMKAQANYMIAGMIRDTKERQAALEKFMADFPESPLRSSAAFQLIGMIRDPEARTAALEKFVAEYPKSASAGMAMQQLFDAALKKRPIDDARVRKLIDDFIAATPDTAMTMSGMTMNRRYDAYNTIADRLMENEFMLDKALELIQKAVAGVSEKTPPATRSMYMTTLGQVYYKRKEYDLALENLKKAAAVGEGSGEAQVYIAKTHEAKGQESEALDAYILASTMRGGADLKASAERLYTKKYGSLSGLHEKIDAILLGKPKPFDPGHYQPASRTGKVVLAELFTGAECGPCVSADLAFDGMLERYESRDVAVLVYHLHIPGPDPMTNPDAESRAKYYNVSGTPTAIFDGTDQHVGGGSASGAQRSFDLYKGKVEARTGLKPPVAIGSLNLRIEGSVATLSGDVDVDVDALKSPEKARLRLALVEEVVHYTGSNGVHFHRYVVRKMLGPAEGIPLQGSSRKVPFRESANLMELAANQKAYLEKYEKDIGDRRPGFRFSETLENVNAKQLLAVAFVQNDETREILQASLVK